MAKQKKIWVLIADGARGRIFIKNYNNLHNTMGREFIHDNLKDSEIKTDKLGRCYESANLARHAYEPRTDWHQHQKQLFAKELCVILKEANEKNEFDELIIVSPPKTLGNLRENLGKQITAKVTAEIHKDVTKFTEHELLTYLGREL